LKAQGLENDWPETSNEEAETKVWRCNEAVRGLYRP
jgi:hypothetical protein